LGVLYYEKDPFEEAQFSIPLGYVDLHDVNEVRAHLKDDNTFELVTEKRLFVFKAENKEERLKWQQVLKQKHENMISEVEIIHEYDPSSSDTVMMTSLDKRKLSQEDEESNS
jgi:hypothetical protein